ncbi:MAG: neutral/alkaline non-lysosomal ceramidase N-terminal domain-containing protein [Aeromicrobium sp.]
MTLQVGRAIADITGEPWGVGMMGYGMPDQWTQGILTRQYARAFVFDDGSEQVVHVVADIGMFFQAAVAEILARLSALFGDRYTARNVVLTATHTHCGPGGHGRHALHNITTAGFHPRTFERLVSGVVDAVARAHDDVRPAMTTVTRGHLTDASTNRSRAAFERNPAMEREHFPDAIDPLMTLLRVERDDLLVGAISWFPVHNTSMSNRSTLISSDNKGWAAYAWERDGADAQTPRASLVTSFAQTNAGDLSPNLGGLAGHGPTDDERENTRIIGERQLAAAKALAGKDGEEVSALLQSRMTYVDLAHRTTPAGPTGRAVLGASFAAGTTDGEGSPLFHRGRHNPVPQWISERLYDRFPRLRAGHAPKDLLIPAGVLGWAQERLPVQLVQIGALYLICLPIEVTVTAGLRLRDAVAAVMSTDVEHVIVQGYANGYAHYLTTPEEYDEQDYEGGSTIFGRQQLPAIVGVVAGLAEAMRDGRVVDEGVPPRPHRFRWNAPTGSPRLEREQPIAVLSTPESVSHGWTVRVEVAADHPNRVLRPTYLLVEQATPDGWQIVADDSSFDTSITWHRRGRRWDATITWRAGDRGSYRIAYVGRETVRTAPFSVT